MSAAASVTRCNVDTGTDVEGRKFNITTRCQVPGVVVPGGTLRRSDRVQSGETRELRDVEIGWQGRSDAIGRSGEAPRLCNNPPNHSKTQWCNTRVQIRNTAPENHTHMHTGQTSCAAPLCPSLTAPRVPCRWFRQAACSAASARTKQPCQGVVPAPSEAIEWASD